MVVKWRWMWIFSFVTFCQWWLQIARRVHDKDMSIYLVQWIYWPRDAVIQQWRPSWGTLIVDDYHSNDEKWEKNVTDDKRYNA